MLTVWLIKMSVLRVITRIVPLNEEDESSKLTPLEALTDGVKRNSKVTILTDTTSGISYRIEQIEYLQSLPLNTDAATDSLTHLPGFVPLKENLNFGSHDKCFKISIPRAIPSKNVITSDSSSNSNFFKITLVKNKILNKKKSSCMFMKQKSIKARNKYRKRNKLFSYWSLRKYVYMSRILKKSKRKAKKSASVKSTDGKVVSDQNLVKNIEEISSSNSKLKVKESELNIKEKENLHDIIPSPDKIPSEHAIDDSDTSNKYIHSSDEISSERMINDSDTFNKCIQSPDKIASEHTINDFETLNECIQSPDKISSKHASNNSETLNEYIQSPVCDKISSKLTSNDSETLNECIQSPDKISLEHTVNDSETLNKCIQSPDKISSECTISDFDTSNKCIQSPDKISSECTINDSDFSNKRMLSQETALKNGSIDDVDSKSEKCPSPCMDSCENSNLVINEESESESVGSETDKSIITCTNSSENSNSVVIEELDLRTDDSESNSKEESTVLSCKFEISVKHALYPELLALKNYFVNDECLICGFVTTDCNFNSCTHMEQHVSSEGFLCHCHNFSFSQPRLLYSHILSKEEYKYMCALCFLRFKRKHYLYKHCVKSHGKINVKYCVKLPV